MIWYVSVLFYYLILVLRLQLVSPGSTEQNPTFWQSFVLSLFRMYTSSDCNDSRRRRCLQENRCFFIARFIVTWCQNALSWEMEKKNQITCATKSPLFLFCYGDLGSFGAESSFHKLFYFGKRQNIWKI